MTSPLIWTSAKKVTTRVSYSPGCCCLCLETFHPGPLSLDQSFVRLGRCFPLTSGFRSPAFSSIKASLLLSLPPIIVFCMRVKTIPSCQTTGRMGRSARDFRFPRKDVAVLHPVMNRFLYASLGVNKNDRKYMNK